VTTPPLLSVEDLAVEFDTAHGSVPALQGVSFSLPQGEVLGIVGESGSGKTVACRSIMRLLAGNARIRAGRIQFEGRDMLALDERELGRVRGERVAMIFQNPSTHLDPLMTVGRQVGEALQVHHGVDAAEARRQSIELLADMRIAEPERRVDAYAHQLSGGMRQRVMIAAALACKPSLLLADEPTTALDVTIQAQILALLRDLQRELGTAILLITHDLGVVNELADRIAVMYAGKLVEEGSRVELLGGARHPYTKGLLRAVPSLGRRGERLAEIPGVVPPPSERPPGCRFATRCPVRLPRCYDDYPGDTLLAPGHLARCHVVAQEAAG
jgi:oligopeptide/dipeptide ABC transporter ATP-binding protein